MPQSSGAVSTAPMMPARTGERARVLPGALSSVLSSALPRWLRMALLAAVIGLAAGALAAYAVPVRYTAQVQLVLEDGRGPAIAGDNPRSAAAIIASGDFLREAADRAGIVSAQDLGPPLLPPPLARFFSSLGFMHDPTAAGPESARINAFADALTLRPGEAANVLTIGMTAADATLAAGAADAVAQVYLERRRAAVMARDAELAQAGVRVGAVRAALQQALEAARAFREDAAGIRTARSARMAENDLALLLAERAAYVLERDAIARRLTSVTVLADSTDLFRLPDEGVNLLRHLVEQRLSLRADLAAENRIRDARHWRVRALTARAADLDDQIRTATGSARAWLADEQAHFDRRIVDLDAAIALRQAILTAAGDNARRQGALDGTVREAQIQLELERERQNETLARTQRAADAARVRAYPDAATRPDWHMPAVAGGLAALLAALLTVALYPSPLRSVPLDEHAESAAPVPAPAVAGGQPLAPLDIESAHETGLAALMKRLAIAQQGERARRILVLGADDGADAAGTAQSLARHLAGQGRTILLDFTRIAPEAENTPGFADLVAGRASFAEIIARDAGSRLHRTWAGHAWQQWLAQTRHDPAGDTVELALAALEQTYEWVVCAVSGPQQELPASLFSARADGVVLAVGGGEVDAEAFAAYEVLRSRGVDNVVIALTGAAT